MVVRVAGKRSLSQLSAFDLIVTVALGSVLASTLLDSTVSFVEGALAVALLAALQFIIAFASARSRSARRAVTARPRVLLWRGRVDDAAMRSSRLADSDLLQAVRESGYGDLPRVGAVVLEANGRFSVISQSDLGDASSLADTGANMPRS